MTKISIKPNPTFFAVVDIPQPGAEALKINFEFKHRSKTDLEEMVKASKEQTEPRPEADVLMDVVAGWKDVKEAFNAKTVAQFLNDFHGAGDAILGAYFSELKGTRRGN